MGSGRRRPPDGRERAVPAGRRPPRERPAVEAPHGGRHPSLEASRVALESLVEGRLRGHRPPDALEGDPIGEQVGTAGLGAALELCEVGADHIPARKEEGRPGAISGWSRSSARRAAGVSGSPSSASSHSDPASSLLPRRRGPGRGSKRAARVLAREVARRSTVPAGHEATAAPTAAGMDEGFVPRIVLSAAAPRPFGPLVRALRGNQGARLRLVGGDADSSGGGSPAAVSSPSRRSPLATATPAATTAIRATTSRTRAG